MNTVEKYVNELTGGLAMLGMLDAERALRGSSCPAWDRREEKIRSDMPAAARLHDFTKGAIADAKARAEAAWRDDPDQAELDYRRLSWSRYRSDNPRLVEALRDPDSPQLAWHLSRPGGEFFVPFLLGESDDVGPSDLYRRSHG